jgi:hypothetical protein
MSAFYQIVRDSESDGEWHITFVEEREHALRLAKPLVSQTVRRAKIVVFACETGEQKPRTVAWQANGTFRL